jgi:mono/diheme cytochrome c family protein
MPAFSAPRTSDREVWQMLAYLRTLAAPAPADQPPGNAEDGAIVFGTHCASCHRVNAKGGRLEV